MMPHKSTTDVQKRYPAITQMAPYLLKNNDLLMESKFVPMPDKLSINPFNAQLNTRKFYSKHHQHLNKLATEFDVQI